MKKKPSFLFTEEKENTKLQLEEVKWFIEYPNLSKPEVNKYEMRSLLVSYVGSLTSWIAVQIDIQENKTIFSTYKITQIH